ncbi:MAG: HD domain-containing protein [Bacteroidetes bacterium]|nr:HD domain-containing protein [Bacteroidota bacterium]
MDEKKIIHQTAEYIKTKLKGEGSGHDWWHIYRVWKNAIHIGKQEKTNLFVVELAALLHDIADWKFYDGNEEIGPQMARKWLEKLAVEEIHITHVCQIIKDISFKGAGVSTKMKTIEGKVVQDADRLDALGAIGIARTFAYGGSKGREIYNPDIQTEMHLSFEQYKKSQSPTLNHFYEKLLLLKDLMNTTTAKKMALRRHKTMENFLDEFYHEWNSEI